MHGGRWPKGGGALYNHPVSSVIVYFIANLCASSNKTDSESGGHLKYKSAAKVEQNEEALTNRVVLEPVEVEWMFSIPKA